LPYAFAPGWRAVVNGAPARVYSAYDAVLGVEIPAGDVAVTLRFEPPYLVALLALSLLTGVVVLAACARTLLV
jgi:uncharacterized membrane protein YfhO